jgi:hypothetical protein
MNHRTCRTMLQRGGMPGAILALDTVSPALANRRADGGLDPASSAGSISRAALLNRYFWLDPVKHVTGTLFTQILPFFDERIVALYGEFERGLHAGLA